MSERDPTTPPWWQIVLGIQVVVLMIALVTPVTPSKTGSQWNPAGLFFEAPTYLHEVLVYFVMTNALVGGLGIAFVVADRLGLLREPGATTHVRDGDSERLGPGRSGPTEDER